MIRLWCRCAATGTKLKLEFLPYERLCYDGVLEESVKGAALPLPEDCIAPTGCALDQASQDNLGYPPHMQVALLWLALGALVVSKPMVSMCTRWLQEHLVTLQKFIAMTV